MSVEAVVRFYGILALVANAAVLGLVVVFVTGRRDRLATVVGPLAIPGALVVAVLAMGGSLYFSEVAHFEPCRLCWYQRIAMYPLVPVLALAVLARDRSVWRYGTVLAALGSGISVWHYAVEWVPSLGAGTCDARLPCSVVWFREFGFISLPYLALSAFLLIAGLLWVGAREPAAESPAELLGEPA